MEEEKKGIPGRNGGTIYPGGRKGNAGGRPPKLPSLDYIGAKILSEGKPDDSEGEQGDELTRLAKIVNQLAAKAENGDIEAAKVLLNRFYGLPKGSMDVTSDGKALTESKPTILVNFQPRNDEAAE